MASSIESLKNVTVIWKSYIYRLWYNTHRTMTVFYFLILSIIPNKLIIGPEYGPLLLNKTLQPLFQKHICMYFSTQLQCNYMNVFWEFLKQLYQNLSYQSKVKRKKKNLILFENKVAWGHTHVCINKKDWKKICSF